MSDDAPNQISADAGATRVAPASADAVMAEWAELLRVAGIAIAEQDLELRYTAVLDQAGLVNGGVHLLGRTDADVFVGQTLAQIVALKRRVIVSGTSARERIRVDGSDGAHWFEASATPRRDAQGRTSGVLSLCVDLTDVVRSSDRIRASEARLAGVLESVADAIISARADQTIVFFNPAAERMFGVKAEEAIGTTLGRFVPSAVCEAHVALMCASGQAGATTRHIGSLGPLRAVRANGEEFPVEASVSHTGAGGDQLFTVIIRDRSELDQLQVQLLQSQKLEGIGRLAGGVAHDFNNLLTVILGNCELLKMRQRGGTELDEISNAARRASQLTRQLLAFSRRQVQQVETIDLNGLVRGLNRMLRRIIGEDVQLQADLGDDAMWVVADVGQMEQVLLNLVVNARDAMPRGGTLRIATRIVDHALPHAPGVVAPCVELAVSDTGVGMTHDVQSRIFEPFFTTKGDAGTGLRLATVYGIVTQSGGNVACTSDVEQGSTFQVWLPLAAAPAEPATGPASAGHAVHGHETVLLVEDEALVRDLAARSLREYGYTVLEAQDTTRALQFIEHPDLAIVVSDVVMPGRSGDDLLGELARRRPSVPILLMTGYSEALLKGPVEPSHLLRKPFTPTDLVTKIRHLLDRPS